MPPSPSKEASNSADSSGSVRRNRGMLASYYGLQEHNTADCDGGVAAGESSSAHNGLPGSIHADPLPSDDPCDIDSPSFNPDLYLHKMMKEKTLTQLMDTENDMVKQIRALDNDMQTLVYENYNKFISATDTIKKMKTDFRKMETEMRDLNESMSQISTFSSTINTTLQGSRSEIQKLSSVHRMLKKLKLLFELPSRISNCIDVRAYSQAVRYYTRSARILEKYEDIQSFRAIREECDAIIVQLVDRLKQQLAEKNASPRQLTQAVELLLELGEPPAILCSEYLKHAQDKLETDLTSLESQVNRVTNDSKEGTGNNAPIYMDVLEFVDIGCNGFVTNISLVISTYHNLFIKSAISSESVATITDQLEQFARTNVGRYIAVIEKRVNNEVEAGSTVFLVRALDRFYRRLVPLDKLVSTLNVSENSMKLISAVGKAMCTKYFNILKDTFTDGILQIRQQIVQQTPGKVQSKITLADMLAAVEQTIIEKLKSVLTSLHAFCGSDITFACRTQFNNQFAQQFVREGVVVAFIKFILTHAVEMSEKVEQKSMSQSPIILLVMSRLCQDYNQMSVSYILSIADEQFSITDKTKLTPVAALSDLARNTAKKIVTQFTKTQGLQISQMIRKSVETRDWINTIEPRTIRAVMKRVVEDITLLDIQVGQLYEEGKRKEKSSDSGKRSMSRVSGMRQPNIRNYNPSSASGFNSTLMTNIQKLFSERIDVFDAIQFNKISIMTGIIKICLKTLLECVRLRTFGKFGLQQMQVDAAYLQMYLWRFVSDETLVTCLLDEIVTSAAHRCLDPSPMEPSVIELICERG